MLIEMRDLRWAIAAAQGRSLRQAAEKLGVRQSTLSRALQTLEHQLGTALFQRTTGGSRPTSAGARFLSTASQIVQQLEIAAAECVAEATGNHGQLTIGIQGSASASGLRAILAAFSNRFPDVAIRLISGSRRTLLDALASSVIDIALVVERGEGEAFRLLRLWSERLVVALPEGHPLCAQTAVAWADLASQRILLPRQGLGDEISRLLAAKSPIHHGDVVRHDLDGGELCSLVSEGWGLTLTAEGAAGATYAKVVFREVHDVAGVTRLDFIARWRSDCDNPAVQRFLVVLTEQYPDLR